MTLEQFKAISRLADFANYYIDGLEIGYWYENFFQTPNQYFYYAR